MSPYYVPDVWLFEKSMYSYNGVLDESKHVNVYSVLHLYLEVKISFSLSLSFNQLKRKSNNSYLEYLAQGLGLRCQINCQHGGYYFSFYWDKVDPIWMVKNYIDILFVEGSQLCSSRLCTLWIMLQILSFWLTFPTRPL